MEIKYLVMSDLHLGHKVNKIENMVNNFYSFFKTYHNVIKDIDILFIAGDIFDNYIPSYTITYTKITNLLIWLVNWCEEHDVMLRILEGTPSHDWKQISVLTTIMEEFPQLKKFNYKYHSVPTIEYIKKYDINILYVPDQVKPKGEDVLKDVKKLFKQHNLKEVDIAIMHGQFHYQFPRIKLDSSHDEQEYLNMVKHYIHIGHIHTHSSYDRIIAQGSFDRIAHGEEENKGCVVANIDTTNRDNDEWMFLVNDKAMRFITLNLNKLEDKEALNIVVKNINILPAHSNIRLHIQKERKGLFNTEVISNLLDRKEILLKFIHPEDNKLNIEDKVIEDVIIDTFSITKENILDLVKSEMDFLNIQNRGHLELLNKYIGE